MRGVLEIIYLNFFNDNDIVLKKSQYDNPIKKLSSVYQTTSIDFFGLIIPNKLHFKKLSVFKKSSIEGKANCLSLM